MTRLVRFSNNAVSNLAANLTLSGTSLSVTSGEGAKFPALSAGQYFMATLVKLDGSTEVVKVTARSTDTMTIVRAAEPVAGASTAYTFSAGDRIEARLTAGVLSDELDRLDNGAVVEALNKSANYTLVEADVTKLVRVNTASGTTTITLPDTSALTDDYDVIVAKVTSDANTVVIARTGTTDLINGATSHTIYNQWQSAWLIADRSTNTWTVISNGISAVNTVVDAGTGSGSATITLTGDPGSKNNTALFIGGVYQQKSTYSISGTTLTAGGAIASGVGYDVVWSAPLTVGTPSDGTVSTAKLVDNALAATTQGLAKMADGFLQATTAGLAKMADGFLAATTAGRAKMADLFVTTAKLDNNAVTLAKMARVGTAGQVLTSGGTGADPSYATMTNSYIGQSAQLFTASGTFTVPAGVTAIKVTVVGGGGGGGGAPVAPGCGAYSGAGGWGGGAAQKWISGLTPGATVSVTVGAGGAGGAASNSAGGTGGTSSFGAYATATGGGGGGSSAGAATGAPGYGSTGDALTQSLAPLSPIYGGGTYQCSGSLFGVGAVQQQTSPSAGNAATLGYGGAGAGARSTDAGGSNRAGGAGKAGCVLVEW